MLGPVPIAGFVRGKREVVDEEETEGVKDEQETNDREESPIPIFSIRYGFGRHAVQDVVRSRSNSL
jgi:hypothetical protein